MDVSNLSRVLSPTLVGHAVANPEPMTILQDTKRQPKVRLQTPSAKPLQSRDEPSLGHAAPGQQLPYLTLLLVDGPL